MFKNADMDFIQETSTVSRVSLWWALRGAGTSGCVSRRWLLGNTKARPLLPDPPNSILAEAGQGDSQAGGCSAGLTIQGRALDPRLGVRGPPGEPAGSSSTELGRAPTPGRTDVVILLFGGGGSVVCRS